MHAGTIMRGNANVPFKGAEGGVITLYHTCGWPEASLTARQCHHCLGHHGRESLLKMKVDTVEHCDRNVISWSLTVTCFVSVSLAGIG
jgi:hypothetical protein